MRELLHNPEDAAASQYRGGGGRLQAIADPLLPPFRVSPETPRAVASRGVRISGVRAPYPQAGSRPASASRQAPTCHHPGATSATAA